MSTSIQAMPLFHLQGGGEFKPAVTLGQGMAAKVSGLPAFYYWKDAIVVGSYVHPAGRFTLDITRDKLDGYAATFKKMKSNGVGVPILMDHAASAAATLGWILDVKRDGDRLMELHQFLGDSARDIGLRNKVSLGIDPDFTDGKGNHYGEAIVHSAVTPLPVVPNQGAFVPAEESGWAAAGKEVVMLSLHQLASPTAKPEEPVNPAADLNLALMMMADAVAVKRDLAVARGGLDAGAAAQLFDLLVRGTDGTLRTMTLSRSSETAGPLALAVFDLLSRNRPVPLGEVTQLQVLSRMVPGEDAEARRLQERMIALASGS